MLATWNIAKRYQKPILFTVGLVGGAIGLNRYISSWQERWQQSGTRSFVSEVRKKDTYFDEAINIGNGMANKQFKSITKKLREFFKIEDILNEINEIKKNGGPAKDQIPYYEKLKLEIFTYLISEVYVISFYITYLRVQLSIVSGKMYYDNIKSSNKNENSTWLKDPSSRYHMFLNCLENYQEYGIEHIVKYIRKVVAQSFGDTMVISKVNLKEVLVIFNGIKSQISDSFNELSEDNVSIVFSTNKEHLTPEGLNSKSKIFMEMQHCAKLIDEMFDIAKTPDFTKVISDCVNIGFSNLFDFVTECFLQFGKDNLIFNDQNASSNLQGNQFINPHQITKPLVTLLPVIWSEINSRPDDFDNQRQSEFNVSKKKDRISLLVQYLLCSDSLTCFSANIYEAFCNEHSTSE